MGVGSYLELYTTQYGWIVYDIIWSALSQTLIIYIPFLVIMFSSMLAAANEFGGSGTGEDQAVQKILARTLMSVFLAFVVLIFVMAPTVTLNASTLSYSPRPTFSEPSPADVNQGNDPTVYSNSFGTQLSGDARIPVFWNLVARVSSGITFGVAYSLPRPESIEAALATMSTEQINDPELASVLSRFRNDCYIPARRKLTGWLNRNEVTPELSGLIEEHGADDINWMGSPIFVETQGLYAPCDDILTCQESLQASTPVQGWAFDADRDGGWFEDMTSFDTPGHPYCDEWWDQIENGLIGEVEVNEVWDGVSAFVQGMSQDELRKLKIQKLLRNSEIKKEQLASAEVGAQFNEPDGGILADIAGGGVLAAAYKSTIGKGVAVLKGAEYAFTGINAYANSRKMSYYKKALPTIIGIMLMVIPIIAQFAMLWKNYAIGGFVTLAIIYFAVRFLSALFEIGVWVETNLLAAVMSSPIAFAEYVISGGIDALEGALAFSFIIIAIFIVVPFLFLYFASALGLALGAALVGAQQQQLGNVNTSSGASFATSFFLRK